MSFDVQREKIKEICKGLLESGQVETVIGYTEGGIEGMRIPYIFGKPEEAAALEWDVRCAPNLCKYLLEMKNKKVGIVAKPCDVRGIVHYLVESQLIRENIYIIGMDCAGMEDVDGDKLPGCVECNIKRPPIFDVRVENREVSDEVGPGKDAAEKLAGDLDKFKKEMDKCILCFSCRQSCYGCYCKVCFMDRGVPNWQPAAPDAGAKMVYHLGRAMHLSGRCIECGACERVCASGVNVRYLIQEVTGFVEKIYDYRTGLDVDTSPVMASYKFDDREVGFVGGDADE